MTVSELEHRMPAGELVEWMAYFTIEPWGQVQEDFRAGVIASTLVNVMADTKGRPSKPSDFFRLYGEDKKEQTPEQQMEMLKAFARPNG